MIESDRFAVDDEMTLSQLRVLDDQREVSRPITTANADQVHAVGLADDHHLVAVVFHLVHPIGACWHLVSALMGSEN